MGRGGRRLTNSTRGVGQTAVVAFGQQSGSPASVRQIDELLTLLHAAGHTDFRDARGPLGFTQRQAAGKFTRDEASALIEQLQAEAEAGPEQHVAPAPERAVRMSAEEQLLRRLPAERLAAELMRRGWQVSQP